MLSHARAWLQMTDDINDIYNYSVGRVVCIQGDVGAGGEDCMYAQRCQAS